MRLGDINIYDVGLIIEFAKTFTEKKVLDIGCGEGERTMFFKNAGCKIIGIDFVDTRLPEFTGSYDFILADGTDLPFKDSAFDAVVSFDVIEHVHNDETFLSEAFRICKKGGIFFLGTPNRNRLSNKLRQMLGKKINYPLKLGNECIHLREYVMCELVEKVKKVGFDVIKENYVWFGLSRFVGFRRFPAFLNNWTQNIFVFARKSVET